MNESLMLESPTITRLLDIAGIVALLGSAVALVALASLQFLGYEAAGWAAFAFSFGCALALFIFSRVIAVIFYTRDAEALIRQAKADQTAACGRGVEAIQSKQGETPDPLTPNTAIAAATDNQRTAA